MHLLVLSIFKVKELKKIVGNDIVIAIAGNKIDLEKNRSVDEKEAIRLIHTLFHHLA
jgi:hypothetical protein